MGATDNHTEEVLQWLRHVLNPDTEMPTITNWSALFAFAEKQKLTALCLPRQHTESIDKAVLLQWIGVAQLIEGQNKLLNHRVVQLFTMLEQADLRCCLLKGQGNAMMYPDPMQRWAGDIDVWVDADDETVYKYVKTRFPSERETHKHIHFPLFCDASVDMHATPLKPYSTRHRKRMQQWIAQHKEAQFTHSVTLPGTDRPINVPTDTFNAVYQLGHMLIHTFDEGLGLRQLVDYFYVLKRLHLSESDRQRLTLTIKQLGMHRFAEAVMWIENHALGLDAGCCPMDPDERWGRRLLNDILEGGNFGRHSQRYGANDGFYRRGWAEARRDLALSPLAPSEAVAKLGSKMKTAVQHTVRQH